MRRRSFLGFLLAAPIAVPAMAATRAPAQRYGLNVDGQGLVTGVVLDESFTFEVVPFKADWPSDQQMDRARAELEEARRSSSTPEEAERLQLSRFDSLEISGPNFSKTIVVGGRA